MTMKTLLFAALLIGTATAAFAVPSPKLEPIREIPSAVLW
jgi:hypothetical protein